MDQALVLNTINNLRALLNQLRQYGNIFLYSLVENRMLQAKNPFAVASVFSFNIAKKGAESFAANLVHEPKVFVGFDLIKEAGHLFIPRKPFYHHWVNGKVGISNAVWK